MYSAEERARIRWACRRGMLELDVMIMPFYEECFDALNEQDQRTFVALLKCDDPDLFKWTMKHTRSSDPALAAMVDKIVAYNRSKVCQS